MAPLGKKDVLRMISTAAVAGQVEEEEEEDNYNMCKTI